MTKTTISATVYPDGWLGGCIRQVNPHHHEQDALSEQHDIIQIKDIEKGASREKKKEIR